ncbi:hypothetical protein VTK56DRAFT_6967 [Thermocarpiscus australiensis]
MHALLPPSCLFLPGDCETPSFLPGIGSRGMLTPKMHNGEQTVSSAPAESTSVFSSALLSLVKFCGEESEGFGISAVTRQELDSMIQIPNLEERSNPSVPLTVSIVVGSKHAPWNRGCAAHGS